MKKKGLIEIPQGVKASIAFFAATVVTKGISYLTTPIYTRLLSSDDFGRTSVFITWLQLFGIVAMFCLSAGVFNNGMVDYPEERDEYSFSMLILSNIISIIFSIVLLLLYPFIKDVIKLEVPLVLLMLVIYLFEPAYDFWVARQRYEMKYKLVSLWAIVCAVVSPLIAIVCIIMDSQHQLYGRIFGAHLSLLIIYIGFYFYLAKKAKYRINRTYWKSALSFNLPLIPHYLSIYLLGSSDKLMISRLIGDSATAYYSVAYSVASVVMIVWTAANGSLIPYTYEKCKKKEYKSISNVTISLLWVFGVFCVLIILLAPEVVSFMATKDYKEAIYVIPPIVGGVFFQVHYFIYANILYYFKKPKCVMIGSISAMLLNIILNYIFIQQYGYIAAGYTTFICYLIQAAIDYLAMRKVVGTSIYNMKLIVLMSVLFGGSSLLCTFLYVEKLMRYLIVAMILLLGIFMRKKILNIIKIG